MGKEKLYSVWNNNTSKYLMNSSNSCIYEKADFCFYMMKTTVLFLYNRDRRHERSCRFANKDSTMNYLCSFKAETSAELLFEWFCSVSVVKSSDLSVLQTLS